jgi:parvulin-like peptidyl-prolyl isomerase
MRFRAFPRADAAAVSLAVLIALSPASAPAAPRAARLAPPVLLAAADSKPAHSYNEDVEPGDFLPDSTLLVRVDAKTFSARQFVIEYYATFGADRPGRDSLGRVQFMNSLIDREVLGMTARKVGYNIGYEGRAEMRDFTQRILANALFRRLVVDSAQVTDDEIQRTYAQYQLELRLQRILFADRETADRVRRDLIAGRITWRDGVKRYSHARDSHDADGDMGWVNRVGLSIPIADQVYALKPGQISPVIEDEVGPQLLRVIETRPAHPPSLEVLRRQIRNQMVEYRANLHASRVQSMVADYMGFVPDTANISWACRFFPKPVNIKRLETGGTSLEVDESVPSFETADTSRILARWKGGSLSLGRFMIEYSNISSFSRPAANTPEAMTQAVQNVASEPFKAQLAKSRGFDKDPMVVYEIESHYNKLIVTRMYGDSVDARVRVTPAERRAEYDTHPDRYRVPETRRFATIQRGSQAAADSLAAALRAGGDAAQVIAADSARGAPSGMIRTMNAEEHGVFKKIVFEELKAGQVTTMPAGTHKGGVAVVQLLSISPGRMPEFDEVQTAADDNARAEKSEEFMKAWLQRLRQGHAIEAHPELVMRVQLVDPYFN